MDNRLSAASHAQPAILGYAYRYSMQKRLAELQYGGLEIHFRPIIY